MFSPLNPRWQDWQGRRVWLIGASCITLGGIEAFYQGVGRTEVEREPARLFHGVDAAKVEIARLPFAHRVVTEVLRETVTNTATTDGCNVRPAHP